MYQRTELLVTQSEEERCKPTYYLSCPYLRLSTYMSDTAKLWNSAQHTASYSIKSYQHRKSSYQFLSGTRLHVVGIWVCVLQGVTTLLGSGRKREKKDKSLRLGSQHCHICVTTKG